MPRSPTARMSSTLIFASAPGMAFRIAALAARPRSVLELRFGLRDGRPRTLEQIGGELGLTHERVRQIEVRHYGHCVGVCRRAAPKLDNARI